MREANTERNTKETRIRLRLSLDGSGKANIDTGCGFLDHMLDLWSKHARFDLDLQCEGDTRVDYHHTCEDIGIALGQALATALADKTGIARYGSALVPMDETLMLCALDLSGRACLVYDVTTPTEKVGDFDCELAREFMLGFVRNAAVTLHLRMLSGENSHHILEAAFKALARALRAAVAQDGAWAGEIPSTKGAL